MQNDHGTFNVSLRLHGTNTNVLLTVCKLFFRFGFTGFTNIDAKCANRLTNYFISLIGKLELRDFRLKTSLWRSLFTHNVLFTR